MGTQPHELARFVSPYAPDELPALRGRVEVLPPAELPAMLPTVRASVELHTTYSDRAKGFQLATVPVAVAFGVGALVVAVVGLAVPVFSIAALAIFWVAFLGWWLLGWAIHQLVSPDGVALVQALLAYRYVAREQRERHERYRMSR